MMNLDIDLLRSFVTVAEARGFTAAGDMLGLSQSAVSLQIKRLEQRLGQKVFKRARNALALTRHGEVLLAFARRMLDLNDESVRILTAPALAGNIRIGASEYFVPQYLPLVVSRFAKAYPQLHIAVQVDVTAALRRRLGDGELDIVIGRRDTDVKGGKLMFREPLYWVAKRGYRIERTEQLPLVSLSEACAYRAQAVALLDGVGRSWRSSYSAAGVAGMQAAVNAGLGVAALPLSCVQRSMRILGAQEGLPTLPDSEMLLYDNSAILDSTASRLVEVIRDSLPRFSAEVMTHGGDLAHAA